MSLLRSIDINIADSVRYDQQPSTYFREQPVASLYQQIRLEYSVEDPVKELLVVPKERNRT